jgi:hypothetical protein
MVAGIAPKLSAALNREPGQLLNYRVAMPATWLLLFNKVASKIHNGPYAVPVRSNRYVKKHGRIYDFGHRALDAISQCSAGLLI